MKRTKFQVARFEVETFVIDDTLINKFNLQAPITTHSTIMITNTPLLFLEKLSNFNFDEFTEFTPYKGWENIPIRHSKFFNSNFIIESHCKYKNNFALICENNCNIIFTHKIYPKINHFISYQLQYTIIKNLQKEIGNIIKKYYGFIDKIDWIYSILTMI
jgi:hypothetical protein